MMAFSRAPHDQDSSPHIRSASWIHEAGSLLAPTSLVLRGCYEALPMREGPPPAVLTVQLMLNDRGRLALDKTLGGAIDRVEGVVMSQGSDSCTIAV
jgi:hypothetical protein